MELCEQASNEKDPVKMLALVTEINRLLLEKEGLLLALRKKSESDGS